jgi:hypothetical protein
MAVRSNFLVDALLALENRVCLKARLKGHSQYRFIAIPTARVRNQIFFGYIGTDKSRRVSGDADCGGSAYIDFTFSTFVFVFVILPIPDVKTNALTLTQRAGNAEASTALTYLLFRTHPAKTQAVAIDRASTRLAGC